MASASHMETILSVKVVEEAVAVLLQNNFDADSRICLLTLLKMLDRILQHPGDPKVRSVRLNNPAFQQKVANRKGGVEILLACGFVEQQAPPPLLSVGSQGNNGGETLLVLQEDAEKQSHLVTARRLISTRLIQDLGMKAEELPPYRPPPPPIAAESAGSGSQQAVNAFNPYVGHRYDAMSAAIGTNLGPEANYISPTELKLKALQSKQAQLEKSLHKPVTDRSWQVSLPGESITLNSALMAASSSSSTSTLTTSDGALLAQRMQKQQAERQQLQEGGFTTSAMRQVQRLQKQKVYSHVQLTIQFPDGLRLSGKFLPKETIQQVKDALLNDCLVVPTRESSSATFDLYVTPPRRRLTEQATLQDEGLLPAAKVFFSWKCEIATTIGASSGTLPSYVRSELLADDSPATANLSNNDISFPSAKPLVPDAAVSAAKEADEDMKTAASQTKKKKSNREEDLLKRMMGGK